MNDSLLFMTLWILVYCYMILASIDFGAGFYLFYGQVIMKKDALFQPIHDYLSPISELINIAFILLFALICGLSPEISLVYQSTLFAPGIFATILILIKGTFFAMAELTQRKTMVNQICVAGNGITGMMIPPALSIAMVISEGGFLNGSQESWLAFTAQLFSNFYFWTVIVIAVVSILYISAMFFVTFAHSYEKEELSSGMRNFALFWSMPTVLASALTFLGLENQNPNHFMKTLDHYWMFLLSLLCLLIAVTLIFLKHGHKFSFVCVMMQYFFALMGYTQSHLPFIIFPSLKISSGPAYMAGSGWFLGLIFVLSISIVLLFLSFKDRMLRKNLQMKQTLN